MTRDRIWVDGLNLLWAFSRVRGGFPEPDVRRMVSLVETYAAAREYAAVVVLDGTRYEGQIQSTRYLEVITTQPPRTADDVLERRMAEIPPEERILNILVSDDVAMSRMAAGMGVRRMSAIKLAEELILGDRAAGKDEGPSRRITKFNRPFEKL